MKTRLAALTESQLQSYVAWILERIQGAQLQDVRTDGRILVLELYGLGPWILILNPEIAQPSLHLVQGNQFPGFKKQQKPTQLFLKSHAKNLALGEIQLRKEEGRVLDFLFVNRTKEVRLEFILIPHFANIRVFAEGKSIAWSKPKEIPARPPGLAQDSDSKVSEVNWQEYSDQFLRAKTPSPLSLAGSSAASAGSDRAKIIAKKRTAIEKMRASLEDSQEHRWASLGELLKIQDHPGSEFQDLWDSRLSVAENRERAFHKAKEIRRKKAGTLQRIVVVEKEIEQLESLREAPAESGPRKGTQALVKSGSKGQTLNLASGAQAIVGKSAQDNMAILRQSRAWDLWLHLKDEPSAHGVIFREKNQNISEGEIGQVAQWILAKSKLAKNSSRDFKFEVLVVECRFVKPIKGDKLGRVTYSNPRVYSFASKLNL